MPRFFSNVIKHGGDFVIIGFNFKYFANVAQHSTHFILIRAQVEHLSVLYDNAFYICLTLS